MNIIFTKIASRNILLIFIIFAIVLVLSALFLRDSITNKLKRIAKLSNNIEANGYKPEHALLLLRQSDDNFQQSFLSGDSKHILIYRNEYKLGLSQAFAEIDSLLKKRSDTIDLANAQTNTIRQLYSKKLQLSGKLYLLKHNFDSLLQVYAGVYIPQDNASPGVASTIAEATYSSSDTVKTLATSKKKGLFARLKDAIANKNNNAVDLVEIRSNRARKTTDSAAQKVLERDKNAYDRRLKQLQQQNTNLLATQRGLITLNMHISDELESIINEAKELNYEMQNELKKMAFRSYQDTSLLLNRYYLVALFLLLIFAVLLINFIVKLNRSEITLLKENERSVMMAQQKMDLLLHMSHEIRNPLTAIKGFLYAFSSTNLSPRQKTMLDSIKVSSDMLLNTLNDTLDAAKMGTGEFRINQDPFDPDVVLKSVIESVEFSASKKSLTIDYFFEGNKNIFLLGDSFRLKQIMVNLLSNAIKYTKTGGITVKAMLVVFERDYRLQVDITDTGEGISAEQQARLFSKYYQTNSARGKMGTGLGLYICKELIQLQKGQIKVTSAPGKGSTFSFYIPYE